MIVCSLQTLNKAVADVSEVTVRTSEWGGETLNKFSNRVLAKQKQTGFNAKPQRTQEEELRESHRNEELRKPGISDGKEKPAAESGQANVEFGMGNIKSSKPSTGPAPIRAIV